MMTAPTVFLDPNMMQAVLIYASPRPCSAGSTRPSAPWPAA